MFEPKVIVNMVERKWPCPPKEWDETGGIDVYCSMAWTLIKHYPDLHRDMVRQIAYDAGAIAHKERHEYIDNIRIMRVKEPTGAYHRNWRSGCCGESDIVIITSGPFREDNQRSEIWLVGWNHGH